ncbi:MAG: TRAP transporter substrate-binding protein DctP [Deferrisomatales bacterium]
MRSNQVTKLLATVGTIACLLLQAPGAGAGEKVYRWRMQTYAVPGTVGFQSQEIALAQLKRATGGRLDIKLHGAGVLVSPFDQLDACGKGLFEVVHNPDAYSASLDPGFAPIFSAIGLWDNPRQVRIWIESFGGKEIMKEAYARFGVHYAGSTLVGAEPIMSKVPLRTLGDFKGLKIRTPSGLTSLLFQRLGASPVSMAGGEIYTALDTGVIDAAEFVSLAEDVGAGFGEVCDYFLYPSFHGPIAVVNYGVNQKAWDSLPDDLKAAFETMVYQADALFDHLSAAGDIRALNQIKEKGLTQTRLSEQDMRKVRLLSAEIAEEYRKKSPLADRVIQSIFDYLKATGEI